MALDEPATEVHRPCGPLPGQTSRNRYQGTMQFPWGALGRNAAWMLAFVADRCRASPLLAYAGGLEVLSSNLGAPTRNRLLAGGFSKRMKGLEPSSLSAWQGRCASGHEPARAAKPPCRADLSLPRVTRNDSNRQPNLATNLALRSSTSRRPREGRSRRPGAWVALLEPGVGPVVIGLAMGLLAYATPAPRSSLEHATERFREFREQPTAELARAARVELRSATSSRGARRSHARSESSVKAGRGPRNDSPSRVLTDERG